MLSQSVPRNIAPGPARARFREMARVAGIGGVPAVALFTSTFINKVDRKGRVSVPASFRSALTTQSFSGIVAFRSLKFVALDGGGFDRLEQIAQSLDELPEFSDEREGLASILADAHEIPFDS